MNKKRLASLVLLLVLGTLVFTYNQTTTINPTTTPTTSPLNLTELFSAVDESVGCPGIPLAVADIQIDAQENFLSVTSNARRTPGLYMNAIASKPLDFVDDSVYTAAGELRIPEDAQNEQIDINLQRVENSVEAHAEILWDHGGSDLNGWIWTRFQDLNAPVRLFYVRPDSEWHKFKMVVRYEANPRKRILQSIAFDEHFIELNKEMGVLDKAWESSFFLLLETTNKYTNCDTAYNFTGKSQWRNVSVERASIP